MQRLIFAIVCIACTAVTASAKAGPIISVDMDPLTSGIQSTLTTSVGSTFTIDVVISDDGLPVTPTVFDTVALDVSYNDGSAVLGAGLTGPLGGALASNSPFAIDLFGAPPPVFSATGAPLTALPAIPAVGYSANSGVIGLLDPLTFVAAPGPPLSIFSLDFTALSAGSSTIFVSDSPAGSPPLSLMGSPIEAAFMSGSVTVEGPVNTVPEPGSLVLLAIGVALVLFWRPCIRNRVAAKSS